MDEFQFSTPGVSGIIRTEETELIWQGQPLISDRFIASDTIDAGNDPQTTLRRGLILADSGNGVITHYDPTAEWPQNVAIAILAHDTVMRESDGTSAKLAPILWGGAVNADDLHGFDRQAREHLRSRFFFADDFGPIQYEYSVVDPKTTDYSVTPAEVGKWFTNRGATGPVTFTLPQMDRGLRYRFSIEADEDVTIEGPGLNQLVVFNNPAATAIVFGTPGERVGVTVEAVVNDNETKWLILLGIGGNSFTSTTVSTGAEWFFHSTWNQPVVWANSMEV